MKRVLALAVMLLCSCGSPATAKPTASPTTTSKSSPIASANTTSIPLGRSAAAMAYDQARHEVVLFGGLAGQTVLDDTWTWNGQTWAHRQGLTVTPPQRQGAAMAYDEAEQRVILFGGLAPAGPLNDTWAWDGTAWQLVHPAHSPSKREGAPMAYDSQMSAIILFGGVDVAATPPNALDDTWSWGGGDWTQLPIGSAGGGLRPRLGFLRGVNVVERFGDCTGSNNNIYGFDGHTWTVKTVGSGSPPPVCEPSLAGDTSRLVVVLFGGNRGNGASPAPADTWVYDGFNWSKLAPGQSPPARSGAPMVYDSDHHLMVLFGGQGLNQGQSGPLNDTWTWDGTAWTSH